MELREVGETQRTSQRSQDNAQSGNSAWFLRLFCVEEFEYDPSEAGTRAI